MTRAPFVLCSVCPCPLVAERARESFVDPLAELAAQLGEPTGTSGGGAWEEAWDRDAVEFFWWREEKP